MLIQRSSRKLEHSYLSNAPKPSRTYPPRHLEFVESEHVGAEYIDNLGRTYDAVGQPGASQFWNEEQFLKSIDDHLLKSNDTT